MPTYTDPTTTRIWCSWCASNLPFGRFEVNGLEPPLPFEDNSFDLFYSLSIFTHLDEPLQQPWFDEMVRVVEPGGVFLLTFHGRSRLEPGHGAGVRRRMSWSCGVASSRAAAAAPPGIRRAT